MGTEVGENVVKEISTKFILCARNYAKKSDLLSLPWPSQNVSLLLLASYSVDKETVT